MPRIGRNKCLKPVWAFAVMISFILLLIIWAQFLVILIFAGCFYVLYIGFLFLYLMHRKTDITDNILMLKNRRGKIINQIDLENDYEVDYIFKGYVWAIYKVKQDNKVLTFTTRSEGVEYLVKDHFKMGWPPIGMYLRFSMFNK